jgi:hypothetical protein
LVNDRASNPSTVTHYPIYIPSKGRADRVAVAGLLQEHGIPFKITVEPQDADAYRVRYTDEQLVVMDANNQGIHYVRNWMKDHATNEGHAFHWQLDDDIKWFKVRYDGKNHKTNPAHVLSTIEDTVDLYTDIGAASPMYDTWAFQPGPIIKLNRMAASAMLLRNDPNIRFEPEIVEDIDITLQYLTAGYCSLIFATNLITVPTTPTDTGGLGQSDRIGNGAYVRCQNIINKWGDQHFKIITKEKWGNAPRLAPSRIWSTFPQQPTIKP